MYKTTNGWTKESMKACFKARNNGKRCVSSGVCHYIANDGNVCAIGAFIPEDQACIKLKQEFFGVVELLKCYPGLKGYMPLQNIKGLYELQKSHDNAGGSVHDEVCEWIDENVYD